MKFPDGSEMGVEGKEIPVTRWFPADQLPKIPGKISIATCLERYYGAYKSHQVTGNLAKVKKSRPQIDQLGKAGRLIRSRPG